MAALDYALHGVNVQIQDPGDLAVPPVRAGWGTLVMQLPDTKNWFHFAPTTPYDGIEGGRTFNLFLAQASLRAAMVNAQIEEVHLSNGEELVWTLQDPNRLPISGSPVNETFPSDGSSFLDELGGREHLVLGSRGFCLSVHVAFL